MVKLKLFFLNAIILCCFSSVLSQDIADTLLKKKAYSTLKNCFKKGQYNWMSPEYYYCYDSAIQVYPYWYFYHLKAMPSIKMADYEGFVRNCEKSLELSNEDLDYFAYVAFYHIKDYNLTLKLLRKLDALTEKKGDIIMNDNILSLYGLCFSEMGDLDSALDYFNYLIDTGNDDNYKFFVTLHDYTNRGVIHLKLGNYQKAKKDFQSTIKEYSQSVEGHYYLALTRYHLGEDVNEIEPLLKIALCSYDKGLKNNHPYGEYVDLPNAVWRSDIMELYYKIKGVKTYH